MVLVSDCERDPHQLLVASALQSYYSCVFMGLRPYAVQWPHLSLPRLTVITDVMDVIIKLSS
eukprot:961440-Amphidinium_carterae.1